MTKILLLSYKKEYQTTAISITDLCTKYNIQETDLSGLETWTKDSGPTEEPAITLAPLVEVTLAPPTKATLAPPPAKATQEEILDDIATFKQQAIKHCLSFMQFDAQHCEVKDFKDMVTIMDSLEKSYKGNKDLGPTVNVLVQNLAKQFKDTVDDC